MTRMRKRRRREAGPRSPHSDHQNAPVCPEHGCRMVRLACPTCGGRDSIMSVSPEAVLCIECGSEWEPQGHAVAAGASSTAVGAK